VLIAERSSYHLRMTKQLKIDFVSDVVCPWCAVGLGGLEQALARLEGEVKAEIHFQPFELNPQMGPEGQDIVEHISEKYGSTPEQMAERWHMMCDRAAEVGYQFQRERLGRIWNTFDAHRLLHWAGTLGGSAQRDLKQALLSSYHEQGQAVGQHEVMLAAVAAAGLDAEVARSLLAGDEFAAEVRDREAFYRQAGITAVPSVIVNDQYLIQGGQPAEAFEKALRQIAQQSVGTTATA